MNEHLCKWINIYISIGMFYFCIGNLNPVLRSKLKSIYLLNMCYYSDIKKYGIDTILEPIIKEVRILEKVRLILIACNFHFIPA